MLLVSLYLMPVAPAQADSGIRGNLAIQSELFSRNAQFMLSEQYNGSASASFEYYKHISGGRITVAPFARVDGHDAERSHADLRELMYSIYSDNHELRIGIGSVFWGVAESRNIVDVVNQLDNVESPVTTAKLGMPMVHYTLIRDWGTFDALLLPLFRERVFPGAKARPKRTLPVNDSSVRYESSQQARHVDIALRYSHSVDAWDIGLSYFQGTAREPMLALAEEGTTLEPFYYQVQQLGLDVQATIDSWLIKLEAVRRGGAQFQDHTKLVTGFEYSFYRIRQGSSDLGVVAEYLYDGLGEGEVEVFQNEILGGLRLSLNDEQSSEALLAVALDIDDGSRFYTFEASRRIGQQFKFSINATTFANENQFTAELGWYF